MIGTNRVYESLNGWRYVTLSQDTDSHHGDDHMNDCLVIKPDGELRYQAVSNWLLSRTKLIGCTNLPALLGTMRIHKPPIEAAGVYGKDERRTKE